MKKLALLVVAVATLCTVSCKKENVNPETHLVKKEFMKSGGGDKRPSGTMD
ncbi:MAG: hypothetical protein V5804_02410 [Mucilaginibacter sp.]|uniref:hypothetical protein n=1 Tax=Mucilaginibacter sp. TaxID=1882438 RepID=UPI0034E58367